MGQIWDTSKALHSQSDQSQNHSQCAHRPCTGSPGGVNPGVGRRLPSLWPTKFIHCGFTAHVSFCICGNPPQDWGLPGITTSPLDPNTLTGPEGHHTPHLSRNHLQPRRESDSVTSRLHQNLQQSIFLALLDSADCAVRSPVYQGRVL